MAEYNTNAIGRNADEIVRMVQAAQFVAENGGLVCPANWRPGRATLKTRS
jgi:peroxiredoxin (alkyl hydroperoxide reductase subunit C)